jgi:hypothetical protein
MRERAELSGGTSTIESSPGKGATIRASWPIVNSDKGMRSYEDREIERHGDAVRK